jgi:hypothetical protein
MRVHFAKQIAVDKYLGLVQQKEDAFANEKNLVLLEGRGKNLQVAALNRRGDGGELLKIVFLFFARVERETNIIMIDYEKRRISLQTIMSAQICKYIVKPQVVVVWGSDRGAF